MFKYFFAILFLLSCCTACRNHQRIDVDPAYADSLIGHYAPPAGQLENEQEIVFWKGRIDPRNPGMLDEAKYAAVLVARFHQQGDIYDVIKADSTLLRIEDVFNQREAGPFLSLTSNSILQHRFNLAESFRAKANLIGLKRQEMLTSLFDVSFETGRYDLAQNAVNELKPVQDFDYYFRRSKMDHLSGNLDSSISAMLKAADLADGSAYLKRVALSNAADLYIHAGRMKESSDLYRQCIAISSADFHSILGLGWIALVNDHHDSLAERLFRFVESKNKLPDPLFKLTQMADARQDTLLERKYALAFAAAATDSVYGNMYNKYLIELYMGILDAPDKAVMLARKELDNRATPQTYAWYAWSLARDHHKAEAYKVFLEHVSGKPLEGLELYYMGKLMQELDKGYNASEFFKAAYANRYDLSPGMVRDMEKMRE
jgi:hypothetical protein